MRRSTLLFVLLLLVTAGLVLASTFLLIRVSAQAASVARVKPGDAWTYHVMMIGKRIDSPFWREVYAGASEAGAAGGAVIELVGPATDADKKTAGEYLDYAIAARVDGILAYIDDDPATLASLEVAADRGIPVIALENDVTGGPRQSFVGVSSYELGKLLGNLIYEAVGPIGKAVVLHDAAGGRAAEKVMLASVQETVRTFPLLRVSGTAGDADGALGPEETLRRLMLDDAGLDAVATLNVEDTMRAAQALIDLNLGDRISLIAFRESPEILEYVRKGIVRAVVAIDATQMGRKAAGALLEYLGTGHANDYVITDMHVVTQFNVGGGGE